MICRLKDGRPLAVRPAVTADAAELVAYMNRVGGESDNLTFGAGGCRYTVEAEEAFLARTAGERTSAMLVGVSEGEIVAVAYLAGDPRDRLAHNGELGISVRRDHWRLGAGEAMLRELIAFARETGVLQNIFLTVRADNEAAVALYKKIGFAPVGRWPEYFRVRQAYFDALHMVYSLSGAAHS